MSREERIQFQIPPFPNYHLSSYRFFEPHEKHITRVSTEWVMLFMLAGTLRFTEDGEEIALSAGEWYVQRPGLRQSATQESDCPEYYYIHFGYTGGESVPFIRQQMSFPLRGTFPVQDEHEKQVFLRYFDRMLWSNAGVGEGWLSKQAVFCEFLEYFVEQCAASGTVSQPGVMRELCRQLRVGYAQPHIAEKVLHSFHYSAEYLRKRFRAEMNISVSDYVMRLRMEQATVLLLSTNMSGQEIATAVGYEEYSTFIRQFRRTYHTTPLQWRKAVRNV